MLKDFENKQKRYLLYIVYKNNLYLNDFIIHQKIP